MRDYLISMREEEHLSQQKVAQRAGITQAYYSYIEQGKRQKTMSFETMQKLAQAFDIPAADIFKLESEYQQGAARAAG